MTRKDYVAIAAALKASASFDDRCDGKTQLRACCHAIANALADENPRFDRARFLKACGVSP